MSWRKFPLKAKDWLPPETNPRPWAGLVSSFREEKDYFPKIEGELPEIQGTLYRVGPGLYDRGPDRKRMVLDGDGMIQAFSFSGKEVRFTNRFVKTKKYLEEEKAGHYIYPTFSTHGSGPLYKNFGIRLGNQANTTVIEWNHKLYAFDEGQKPYLLNANTLDTIEETILYPQKKNLDYWAHWQLDSYNKQLHCLAIEQGPKGYANVISFDQDAKISEHHRIVLNRMVYFHDWFCTPNYFAFVLHPAEIKALKMLEVAVARNTFSEILQWKNNQTNLLVVYNRNTKEAFECELKGCWMWHSVNAWEENSKLFLDFIGSEEGGGLGSEDQGFFQIMKGNEVLISEKPSNFFRRYLVDLDTKTAEEEILCSKANFELPSVSATRRGLKADFAYMIQANEGELFASHLHQFDYKNQSSNTYSFNQNEFVSEPMPLDHMNDAQSSNYIASEVYDGNKKKSYLAIFKEDQFLKGPVCKLWLDHHIPLSFHGYFSKELIKI